jgi:hypothetical protein
MRTRDAVTIRIAATLVAATGIGFEIATPIIIRFIEVHGRLPTVLGIRALSDGPFEQMGMSRMIGLAWILTALCWLEVLSTRHDGSGPRTYSSFGRACRPKYDARVGTRSTV